MDTETNSRQPWFTTTQEAALAALDCSGEGLVEAEVARRRDQYGYNSLPVAEGQSWLRRLMNQFANILILVLLVAGVGTWLMGHRIDALVIFGVAIINDVIGYVDDGKAEASHQTV